MIQVFPSFYPDELVYSMISRYHVQSGSVAYIYTAEELFDSKYTNVEIEFLNKMSVDGIKLITRNKSIEAVINEHTMFPYYARFVSAERRNRAFQSLINKECNMNQVLNLETKNKVSNRCLNYCPACASEDREKYGETYWHRNHQIRGISVCARHGCYLHSSPIPMRKKTSPQLTAAELVVPYESTLRYATDIEIRLTAYVTDVFQSELNMDNDVDVGEYLHHHLLAKYLVESGVQRYLTSIYEDYRAFYQGMPEDALIKLQRIEKILNGKVHSCYEVCQLALFEGISVEAITNLIDDFSCSIQNHIFEKIAKEQGIDYELVRSIGEAVLFEYRKENRVKQKGGAKSLQWERMDEELLPEIKNNCLKMYGNGSERPHRVTIEAVRKSMNLPCKRIEKLPRCKAEILRYHESMEEYWAREVIWAYQKIVREGGLISWKKIRDLINIRNTNFQMCKPYLMKHTDEQTAALICNLL